MKRTRTWIVLATIGWLVAAACSSGDKSPSPPPPGPGPTGGGSGGIQLVSISSLANDPKKNPHRKTPSMSIPSVNRASSLIPALLSRPGNESHQDGIAA